MGLNIGTAGLNNCMLGTQQVDRIMLGTTEVWSAESTNLYYVDLAGATLKTVDILSAALLRSVSYNAQSNEYRGTAVVGSSTMFRARAKGYNKRDAATGTILSSGEISWLTDTVLMGTRDSLYTDTNGSSQQGFFRLDPGTLAIMETTDIGYKKYIGNGGGSAKALVGYVKQQGSASGVWHKFSIDPVTDLGTVSVSAEAGCTNWFFRVSLKNKLVVYDAETNVQLDEATLSVNMESFYKDGGK